MTDYTVDLDGHRDVTAQKATVIRRRRLADISMQQAAERHREQEYETGLFSAPSRDWLEAAEKACYLLQSVAATADPLDSRRDERIADTLADLRRLSECAREN